MRFVHFYVRQRRNVLHQRVVHDRKPHDPFLLLTGSGPATATYRYYISFIGQMQYFSSAKRARPFRDCSGRVFCFFLLFFIRRNGSTAYNSFFFCKKSDRRHIVGFAESKYNVVVVLIKVAVVVVVPWIVWKSTFCPRNGAFFETGSVWKSSIPIHIRREFSTQCVSGAGLKGRKCGQKYRIKTINKVINSNN